MKKQIKEYIICPHCGLAVNDENLILLKTLPTGWKKILIGTPFEAFFIEKKLRCKECINKE